MSILQCLAPLINTGDGLRDVRRFLRAAGRLDTLRHVAQVNAAGRRLARRFGLGLEPVDLACTAHDLAAVIPLREIVSVADELGAPLTAADRAIPQIVHGPVAAAILEQRLGVDDDDVLNAVRFHTTLRAGASRLERLVFIADKVALDPTARHTGFQAELLAARDTASLVELCLIYLEWAVREGPGLGWTLHPNLIAAREDLRHLILNEIA
jgi:predicted HD superfamily hydrolase involved in NAD metabolism